MKIFSIILFSLSLLPSVYAEEIGTLKITSNAQAPVVVYSNLILNPGTDDETVVWGPWFSNSYTIDCENCEDTFFLDTLVVTTACTDKEDFTEHKKGIPAEAGKGRKGEGLSTGSFYFDELPECEPSQMKVHVEAIGYDESGKYLAGEMDHDVE